MRRFEVRRPDDSLVGEGAQFVTGTVVLAIKANGSLLVYPDVEEMEMAVMTTGHRWKLEWEQQWGSPVR